MAEITYGDIEAVTRELITMAVAHDEDFGLVRLHHVDAMCRAIAARPVAATQELVRADIGEALHCFDMGAADDH